MLLGRAREAVEAGQTEIAVRLFFLRPGQARPSRNLAQMATRVKELKKGIKQALRG